MEEIQELILYENENVRLDFKRDEYVREKYSAFLKDVMSMANAFTHENRYIIIGLKPKADGDRGFVGIEGNFTDSATYQQLVFENIEPELSIEYYPYNFEKYVLGILKISGCNNPPYLMKKEYGDGKTKLFKGEGFIRKGTHQTRLTRADFDKYCSYKINDKSFKGEIIFTFITEESENEITLIALDEIKRPSQIKKKKIETILKKKKKDADHYNSMGISEFNLDSFSNPFVYMDAAIKGTGIPYENRDIQTLEEDLKNVEETYLEHDFYELFEKQTNKCNITILNKGNQYIEDASLILKIPKIDGILVSEKIYRNPDNKSYIGNIGSPLIYYPTVREVDNFYIIEDHVGDIKHLLPKEAFKMPIRVLASNKVIVDSIKVTCELYAKNILTSITDEIVVRFKKCTTNKSTV